MWTLSSAPCRKDVPHLRRVQERFGARGLAIVGMNVDDDLVELNRFLESEPMPWIQASAAVPEAAAAVNALVRDRLRIQAFPSKILIDPRGKIVTLDGLRGDELDATLERVLSP